MEYTTAYLSHYLSHVEFRRGRWLVWITDDDFDEFDTREEAKPKRCAGLAFSLKRFDVEPCVC